MLAYALIIVGWTLAFINWLRVRALERTQEELLRRLSTPLTHRSMGAMLLGLVLILFVASRHNHWLAQYAQVLLALLGWAGALGLWLECRTLRRRTKR